jgi:hypothetical protein
MYIHRKWTFSKQAKLIGHFRYIKILIAHEVKLSKQNKKSPQNKEIWGYFSFKASKSSQIIEYIENAEWEFECEADRSIWGLMLWRSWSP